VESIGGARESRGALSWIAGDGGTSSLARHRLRWVLAKQIFDLTCSLVLLLLVAPLLASVALAVRLSSPGPILFVQSRIGKNG